jgi:hypothetical protein
MKIVNKVSWFYDEKLSLFYVVTEYRNSTNLFIKIFDNDKKFIKNLYYTNDI